MIAWNDDMQDEEFPPSPEGGSIEAGGRGELSLPKVRSFRLLRKAALLKRVIVWPRLAFG